MLLVAASISNEISSFCQSRNRPTFNMFNLFRLCRKDKISFDIVAETDNIVAQNGNNVEATFDYVERTKFYDTRSTLLPFVATKSNVASTKSNVASTMLLRHCCRCGRSLTLALRTLHSTVVDRDRTCANAGYGL